MSHGESSQHLALKRLALVWAQQNGFGIAGVEVSLPHLRLRVDAAAFRPARDRVHTNSGAGESTLGPTAIFECKQIRADFLRDSKCAEQIRDRLRVLHERRALYEESMRQYFPSLRCGDALFPEFEGFRFEAAGFEPYDRITAEIRQLSYRLHEHTKFANLLRWRAANLHYVVAEANVAAEHELPAGWGLLVRSGDDLELRSPAVWQEIAADASLRLVMRIAMSGTRAIHRALAIPSRQDGATQRLDLTQTSTPAVCA